MTRAAALIAGALSVLAGLVLLAAAVAELLRYSPYENPGAGTAGLWLGIAAVILIGWPAVAGIGTLIAGGYRARRSMLAGMTPDQRFAYLMGEALVAEVVHHELHEHNKREDARLTASVMGERRES